MRKVHFFMMLLSGVQATSEVMSSKGNDTTDIIGARERCDEAGTYLVLPQNHFTNTDVANYVKTKDDEMAWINAEIIPTVWHSESDQRPAQDQGCYSLGDVEHSPENLARHFASYTQCTEHCQTQSYKYAAIQGLDKGSPGVKCYCSRDPPTLQRLSEDACLGNSSSLQHHFGSVNVKTVRILATDVSSDHDWMWGQENDIGSLCAARYMIGDRNLLRQTKCSTLARFKCTTGHESFQKHTWFDSSNFCRERGGQLSKEGFGWSDVKAWKWKTEDVSSGNIHFTEWDQGHPDFSKGTCVAVTTNMKWITENCAKAHLSVCQEDIDNQTQTIARVSPKTERTPSNTLHPTTASAGAQTTLDNNVISAITSAIGICTLIFAGVAVLAIRRYVCVLRCREISLARQISNLNRSPCPIPSSTAKPYNEIIIMNGDERCPSPIKLLPPEDVNKEGTSLSSGSGGGPYETISDAPYESLDSRSPVHIRDAQRNYSTLEEKHISQDSEVSGYMVAVEHTETSVEEEEDRSHD